MPGFHELPFPLRDMRDELMKKLATLSSGYANEVDIGATTVDRDEAGRLKKVNYPTWSEEIIERNAEGKIMVYHEIYPEQTIKITVNRDSEGRFESESKEVL